MLVSIIIRSLSAAGALSVITVLAQVPATKPQFEVSSIKLNSGCSGPGGPSLSSRGRLTMPCVSLRTLIQMAYTTYEGLSLNPHHIRIIGGPRWLNSEYYDLAAKAEGNAHRAEMEGPMLRALLEDRFKVRVHMESREMPVYSLIVAKGGAKIQPLKQGACLPYDTDNILQMHAPQKPTDPKYCGTVMIGASPDKPTTVAHYYGVSMPELAGRMLAPYVDRPVIDKTGLGGRYDIRLEFAMGGVSGRGVLLNGVPSTVGPTADDPLAVSIFDALQEQLGLKLTSDKGSVQVLVVDSAERPSAN